MILGTKVIDLPLYLDDRGSLFEMIHNYDMTTFGQTYVVTDPVRGIVRGFHKHEKLTDYFCIVNGSAKFVLVDANGVQPVVESYVLSARKPQILVAPPGIFHGWVSLEDNTILVSTADQLYNKANPDEVRIPPESYGDVWSVKAK